MDISQLLSLVHMVALWAMVLLLFILDAKGFMNQKILKGMSFGYLGYLVGMAIIKSVLQWNTWSLSPLTKNFLPPVNPNYFASYAFTHFFLPVLFTVLAAVCFGIILRILAKHPRTSWVSDEESWFGILGSLLAGWPGVILLVAFTFTFMALFGLFQKIARRKLFDKIPFSPFLYRSLLLVLIFGPKLLSMFHIDVLSV